MATYAYLRVSTLTFDQTTENQKKVILDLGFAVDEFFSENGVSGSVAALERPEFVKMMASCTAGDTVICTMVDRLGRNASDILHTVDEFKRLGIRLRVTQFDGIDVTSSTGKMIITVMAALAEMEKNLLVERTKAGLARTKEQGTKLGAPLKITPKQLNNMYMARAAGSTFSEIAAEHSLPRNTVQRNVEKWKGKFEEYKAEYEARQAQYKLKAA